MARIIVVTSGKGGVGKTTPARHRYRFGPEGKENRRYRLRHGLRNLDLIMGCERRVVYDFVNVIQGDATLNQAAD